MNEMRRLVGQCARLHDLSMRQANRVMQVLFLLHYRFPLPEDRETNRILKELGYKRPLVRNKRIRRTMSKNLIRHILKEEGLYESRYGDDSGEESDLDSWGEFYANKARIPEDEDTH